MKSLIPIFKAIKYKLQYGITVEWYNLWYILFRKKHNYIPKIASIDETIDKIISEKCSVSRFGDGEILLTNSTKNIGFQNGSNLLSEKLITVLTSDEIGHLVCLSDTFTDLQRYNHRACRFWRTHFFLYQNLWYNHIRSDKQYYNTFITRPYMDFASKHNSFKWFNSLKKIWNNRDIIFVEGEKSRLGVGNDLFDNAKSIKRILCPPENAFDYYNKILSKSLELEYDNNSLYLIALGPTATILAYDLFKNGRQAIDIGHVDIEYEWCKMKSKRKVPLKHKYVNESANGKNVSEAGDIYEQQIIARI